MKTNNTILKILLISYTITNILINLTKSDNVETKDEIINNHEDQIDPEIQKLESTSNFHTEWEQKMSDYEPTYVYMIPLQPRKKEKFFEDITTVPARIRGAFLSDEANKSEIEFEIISPVTGTIYKNSTNECIFDFEIQHPGKYEIRFKSIISPTEQKVTFTMNTGQNPIVKKEHLSFTENTIDDLLSFMRKIKLNEDLITNKQRERAKRHHKNNRFLFTFSVIETIILTGVSVAQFYFLKQLIDAKENY